MIMTTSRKRLHRHALSAAAALLLATGSSLVQAQLSTATLRGVISSGAAAPQAGTPVQVVNKDNGNTYRTTTAADGSYVLVGLAPGRYEVRVGGAASEVVTLQVGETATLDLTVGGTQQVTIVGSLNRKDVKDSQLGTNVTRRQIESLPQSTRNFLSSVDLAPGVAYTESPNTGQVNLQSGGQDRNNINVYIDGVGQKNNILRNGASGMDATRGNPFPQSAIAEYKVLTQNYKAEFDQVSGAAITAITKSGTNEFHGDIYVDRTGTNWTEKNPFQEEAERNGVPRPPSTQMQYGGAVGGPIVKDRIHFFAAYDGKQIDNSRQVVAQNTNLLPLDRGIVPGLLAKAGSTVDKFHEDLLLGKIDAQLNDDQRLTFSVKVRKETDRVPEDTRLSVPGNDKARKNDETRVDLKHEWTLGSLFSEARLGWEEYTYNPKSASTEPFIKYKGSTSGTKDGWQDVLFDGGSPDAQFRQQRGTFVSEELTWTGAKGHVVKGGIKVKDMKYRLSGTSRSVDMVQALIDPVEGFLYYDGTNCLGDNLSDTGGVQSTDQCHIDRALAPATVGYGNRQFGLYIQDDWSVTKQLEVNLGVRWDYETNMLNNGYVTPAERVTALYAEDGRNIAGIIAPPGQTYADSLALGGINIGDYIADGNSRKPFKGAFAPRVGASYDLFGDRNSIVFGGWGRSYDRTMANHALDEQQKNAQANGEIWLIKNDFKMPYADQYTLGLRQALGTWNAEVAYSHVHAQNQFIWFGGNRDPQGGWGAQSPIDPLWGGPNGFGTLVLGDFVGENKTSSVFVKADKPYSSESGWGLTLAYTYTDAQTTARNWDDDVFDWTYGRDTADWNASRLVDKHRVVAALVTDGLLPWGIQVSAKAVWASGKPRQITDCRAGGSACVYVEGESREFNQFDVGLAKDWAIGVGKLNTRLDVLNVFDTKNYGGYNDWAGGQGEPLNPELGKPNSMRGPMRTLRLVLGYKF
ncbi:MAG TPA: TonB-dependent receptor [Ideonella sp.]|uniref:TonB-dependent receptor n=1 Tax=Ideonella sp. TaxID=1929293 RepID=UPI002E358776|nr:TonB-dependent receptor [Ideonella sp.]HEX5683523.1 TonB-dependent receptor [Ideonella sp.]